MNCSEDPHADHKKELQKSGNKKSIVLKVNLIKDAPTVFLKSQLVGDG